MEKLKEKKYEEAEEFVLCSYHTNTFCNQGIGFEVKSNNDSFLVLQERVINNVFRNGLSINSRISNVVLSEVRKAGFLKHKEIIAYYQDVNDKCYEITLPGVKKKLKEKSYNIVTPDGKIIMCDSESILVTENFEQEKIIKPSNIVKGGYEISGLWINKHDLKVYVEILTCNLENNKCKYEQKIIELVA